MPKGHNQEHNNDRNAPTQKTPGQDGHLKKQARKKANSGKGGRNEKIDQSGGKKGQNAI
jgi:hypothetical protein